MEAAVPTVAITSTMPVHTNGGSKWNIKYERIRWPIPPESAGPEINWRNSILRYKERHSG
ncbi:MAG: hypothetical protein KC729_11760 [Candidatus Eisenbacteria bacterium]|uniref:Uncharacterized protein n=1 Tax=Eiseniibacteriota bacterium TaxID=2212470 RepID=A0A956RQF4_UNCEI|nr:hypothetical protein [Candidatus Eisenbacteria bacterium]